MLADSATSPQRFSINEQFLVTPHNLLSDDGGLNLSELHALSSSLSSQDMLTICSIQTCRHFFGTDKSIVSDNEEDLYFYGLHYSAQIEAKLTQLVGPHVDRILILRDLLYHPALLLHIPACLVEMCKNLFLPQYLNFRNLLWHGFMKPQEIPIRYVALCISLHRTLGTIIASSLSPVGIPKRRYFSSVHSVYAHFVDIFDKVSFHAFDMTLIQSSFTTPDRQLLFRKSFQLYKCSEYKKSIIMLFPIIEYGLRLAFCICNKSFEYIFASTDSYFSTLDGFGQRGKHQLLLDTNIHVYEGKCITSKSKPNELIHFLGDGLFGFLIDLFLTDRGPNVRALFAHGEYIYSCSSSNLTHANDDHLDNYNSDDDNEFFHVMNSAMLALVTALLFHFRVCGPACQHLREIMSSIAAARPLSESESLCDYLINASPSDVAPEYPDSSNTCYLELTRWYSTFHDHTVICVEHRRLWSDILMVSHSMLNRRDITIREKRLSKSGDIEYRVDICVSELPSLYTVTVWESFKRLGSYLTNEAFDSLLADDIRVMIPCDKLESGLAVNVSQIVHTCLVYIQQLLSINDADSPVGQFLSQAITLIHATTSYKNSTITRDMLSEISRSLYDLISITSPPITLIPACLQLQKVTSIIRDYLYKYVN